MKLEDLAYSIAQKVFWELEHTHHFVVPADIQKDVLAKVRQQLNALIK
jgi:hypothetical protein